MLTHEVIKIMLIKQHFTSMQNYIDYELFAGDAKRCVIALVELHEKYEGDVTLPQLREYVVNKHTLTTAQRHTLQCFLDDIEATEVLPDAAFIKDHIAQLHKLRVLRSLGQAAARGLSGEDVSFDELRTIINEEDEVTNDDNAIEEIDLDIDALVAEAEEGNGFRFGVKTIDDCIPPLYAGLHVIIFARPETGKTSFCAFLVAQALKQGKTVMYFANEEPGRNVLTSIARSYFDKSSAQLRAMPPKAREEWDAVRTNLKMYDVGDVDIDRLKSLMQKHKPDIVVADQMDNFTVSGSSKKDVSDLGLLYRDARVIAKKLPTLWISVCQASSEAEGRSVLTMSMMHNSKTDKPGTADIVMGIGKTDAVAENFVRTITFCKNKTEVAFHGPVAVQFNPTTATFSE